MYSCTLVLYVFFSQNQLTEIPTEALKSFPNLKYLAINNNQITEIKNDDFKYNSKLTVSSFWIFQA